MSYIDFFKTLKKCPRCSGGLITKASLLHSGQETLCAMQNGGFYHFYFIEKKWTTINGIDTQVPYAMSSFLFRKHVYLLTLTGNEFSINLGSSSLTENIFKDVMSDNTLSLFLDQEKLEKYLTLI